MSVSGPPIICHWSRNVSMGARFMTLRQPSASWREQRPMLSELRQFHIAGDTAAVPVATAKQYWDMHHQQRGGGLAFLVRPPHPLWRGAEDVLIGTGDGTEREFQIFLPHSHGGGSPYNHPINYFVSDPTIKINDLPAQIGVDYTRTLGLITASPDEGHTVKATFQLYYPVTSDSDDIDILPIIEPGRAIVRGLVLSEFFPL